MTDKLKGMNLKCPMTSITLPVLLSLTVYTYIASQTSSFILV